jgi:glycyl-tRNA synthetase
MADLETFTAVAGRVVEPVEAFFTDVFVMVDDEPLRAARLGLLAAVRDLGEGVLRWHELRL